MRPLQHALLRARMPGAALEEAATTSFCKPIKRLVALSNTMQSEVREAVAVAARNAPRHEGPDVRHTCTQAFTGKRRRASCAGACRGTAGFAHVSCLAEQAKILIAEVEENNLEEEVLEWEVGGGTRVACASKTATASCSARSVGVLEDDVGRSETDQVRAPAMNAWDRFTDGRILRGRAVRERGRVVYEAAPWRIRKDMLAARANLAVTYDALGRFEEALRCEKTYTPILEAQMARKIKTSHSSPQLPVALVDLKRFEEAVTRCAKRRPWRDVFRRES